MKHFLKIISINSLLIIGITCTGYTGLKIHSYLEENNREASKLNNLLAQKNDLKKGVYPVITGFDALPSADGLLSEAGKFAKKMDVYPLNGVPNKMTFYGKEGNSAGATYTSDKYGFRNKNSIYESDQLDYVLIGDSFGHSAGSEVEYGLNEHLSETHKLKGLNLSLSGHNTPEYMMISREYINGAIKSKTPKSNNIIFLIYGSNDWAHHCFTPHKTSQGICKIIWEYLESTSKNQAIFENTNYSNMTNKYHLFLLNKIMNTRPNDDHIIHDFPGFFRKSLANDILQIKIFIKHALIKSPKISENISNIPRNSYGAQIDSHDDLLYPRIFLGKAFTEAKRFCIKNKCNVYLAFAPSYLDIHHTTRSKGDDYKIEAYPNKFLAQNFSDLAKKNDVKVCQFETISNLLSASHLNQDNPFTTNTTSHYSDHGYRLLARYLSECLAKNQ